MVNNNIRARVSLVIKILTVTLAFCGVIWSFFNAANDGYYHWATRLLYFTALSNLWIAFVLVAMLLQPRMKSMRDSTRVKNSLYVLRYVFVVSITLTGFIFCGLLGPSAKHDNYNAWTVASIITHAVVPTLSITDFFIDPYRPELSKKHISYAIIPPFLYLIFISILQFLNVDFGRGDPYPYIFFNYNSPAGFFGFSDEMPYIFGSFYWILIMLAIVLSVGALYLKIYLKKSGNRRKSE